MGASRDFLTFYPLCSGGPQAKWLKQRAFTQGCAFAVKIAIFHTPDLQAPKKVKIWQLFGFRNFSFNLAYNIRGHGENILIFHRSPMKVAL